MRLWKNVVHIAAMSVTLCLFLLGGLFLFLNLFGTKSYVIVSGSMEPVIPTGSIVLVKPEKKQEVQAGDAVAYQLQDGPVVVHRLIEVAEDGSFVMKGDANNASDMETIEPSQVIGPVHKVIPKAGYFGQYLMRSDKGIPLPVLWMVLFMILLHVADALLEKACRKEDGAEEMVKRERRERI